MNRTTRLLILAICVGLLSGCITPTPSPKPPLIPLLIGETMPLNINSQGVEWRGHEYHLVQLSNITFRLDEKECLTAMITGSTACFDNVKYKVYAAVFDASEHLLGTATIEINVTRLWSGHMVSISEKFHTLDFGQSHNYRNAKFFSIEISVEHVLTPDQWTNTEQHSASDSPKAAPKDSAYSTNAPLQDRGTVVWKEIARADFDDNQKDNTSFIWNVPGCSWDIVNGVARLKGTTQTNEWSGTRITLPVKGDDNELVEVSGDFKVAKSDGHQLVALWGGQDDKQGSEALCVFYEGNNGKGYYCIQTRWMEHSSKLIEGSYATKGFGDETVRFHKMKMILDRSTSHIEYFVDDLHLGTIKVTGSVAPTKSIEMDLESHQAGTSVEILYDNLIVRSGKRQPKMPNTEMHPTK